MFIKKTHAFDSFAHYFMPIHTATVLPKLFLLGQDSSPLLVGGGTVNATSHWDLHLDFHPFDNTIQ